MAPAIPLSREHSPSTRPQPYRTNSSPKLTTPGTQQHSLARSGLSLKRTTSNSGTSGSRSSTPSRRLGGGGDGDLEPDRETSRNNTGGGSGTGKRSTRGKKESLLHQEYAGSDPEEDDRHHDHGQERERAQGPRQFIALDPSLRSAEEDESDDPDQAERDSSQTIIHAPQPRRLNMSTSTERLYSTPHGSPSPGGGSGGGNNRYGSALPDMDHPSPSSTPTPGGGGGHESSHSAASKRREANRLAAARFRTRKKDQVTELEGKVAVLEADNANLKAENDVWRSGRDGKEWARMRSTLVGQTGKGGRAGRSGGGVGTGSASARSIQPQSQTTKGLESDDISDDRAEDHLERHDSDEIIPSATTPFGEDPDPLNPSAAGKKRRKTDLPLGSDSDPTNPNAGANVGLLSSSTGSGSGTGSIGLGAVEEENKRLVEQMRRYETVMEGMRGEMREYRERLGTLGKGRTGKEVDGDGDDEKSRPYVTRASSSYEADSSNLHGSQSGYASSGGSSMPGPTLPPLTHGSNPNTNSVTNSNTNSKPSRYAMSREGSNMSLNLPPLSPGLRFASPVHSGGHFGSGYTSGGGQGGHGHDRHHPAIPSPGGGMGFSMATLADAAAATAGGSTFRLQHQHQHQHSRPASPLASLSSSPNNSGHLSKFATLAAATGARRASLDRSRSWTAYSGHPSPSLDAVGSSGMNRLNILSSGRDSPVSAERGTAMDDDDEDLGGRRATIQDEPMEYFDRRVGSALRNTWEERREEDVRMRDQTRSPEERIRRFETEDLPM